MERPLSPISEATFCEQEEPIAPHLVQKKRPPDKSKFVLCSCCKYSSAGKKTVIYSSETVRKLLTIPVVINAAREQKALLDSGASGNFIHKETAREMGLKPIALKEPQMVNDIQGKQLAEISHCVKVALQVVHHREDIELNVIPLGIHGLV